MPTAEQVLLGHGFTGQRLLKLARRIANDELRRRGAFLDHDRLEDLVAFLALHGVRAAARYDPERRQLKYGRNGGDPFASYIADVMSYRVTDWYRSKHEGFGDKRYNNHGRIVLDGEMAFAEPDDAFDRELELRRMETGVDLDEAEQELGQGLSEMAREGLRVARLHAEGLPLPTLKRTGNRIGVQLTPAGAAFEAAKRELAPRVLKSSRPRTRRPPISRPTMSSAVHKPPLLALPDVSARLNYSEKTVRRLIAKGALPAIQPGGARGRIRVDADELERWLAEQRIPVRS